MIMVDRQWCSLVLTSILSLPKPSCSSISSSYSTISLSYTAAFSNLVLPAIHLAQPQSLNSVPMSSEDSKTTHPLHNAAAYVCIKTVPHHPPPFLIQQSPFLISIVVTCCYFILSLRANFDLCIVYESRHWSQHVFFQ